MNYPDRIKMLQVNDFGRLSRVPLGSDKGRVYELVPEPPDALKLLKAENERLLGVLQAFKESSDIWLPTQSTPEQAGEVKALHRLYSRLVEALATKQQEQSDE